jgi:nucleoid DNA-binding protein
MDKQKFTRADIREILRSGAGLDAPRAREVTGRIIGALAAALAAGRTVELRGLGTLEPRERKARRAHNPRTLTPVEVPAHHAVRFKPCKKLKDTLKGGPPM